MCPSGLKLSHDSDGFHPYDDQYTILCTTRGTYNVPKSSADWPSCVNFCPKRIPYVPLENTGLIGVDAPNTVPSGEYGRYVCSDTSLGVDQVYS